MMTWRRAGNGVIRRGGLLVANGNGDDDVCDVEGVTYCANGTWLRGGIHPGVAVAVKWPGGL